MKIDIINPTSGLDTPLLETCMHNVFSGEDKTCESINIIFMERDELRLMKKEYFDLDVFTDIIAFNLNEPYENIEGELYLSEDQINENAETFKTDPQVELIRVLIHGCLHLCGYEDDTPKLKDQMTVLENLYIDKLKGLKR